MEFGINLEMKCWISSRVDSLDWCWLLSASRCYSCVAIL